MSSILVVDDDPISAGLVSNALNTAGYQTTIANDGWQACQMLQKEPFDAMVTDEIMSVMNGLELCHRIKELGIELPVVMVTCLNEELSRVDLREELGIVAVLGKPFNPHQLLSAVRTHVKAAANSAVASQ